MELKLKPHTDAEGKNYPINRTIMELKPVESCRHIETADGYQSHHYGIETEFGQSHRRGVLPINRTIMELKRTSTFRRCLPPGYQSHHYGIET